MRHWLGIFLVCFYCASYSHNANSVVPAYGVFDFNTRMSLYAYNTANVKSIASLTKLMTAYIFLTHRDNNHACATSLNFTDIDTLKHTHSRIPKGESFSCLTLLNTMLVSSDNMAAMALSRVLMPRGDFIELMNLQAQQWGMIHTHYVDPTGLSPENISTVEDLEILIEHVLALPLLSSITSQSFTQLENKKGDTIVFRNSNKMVRELGFNARLSKTGHINESGYNLIYVNQTACSGKIIGLIILGAASSENRTHEAIKLLRKWNCPVATLSNK